MPNEVAKPAATSQPNFLPGAFTSSECMMVDSNGVAWWINPACKTIEKVECPTPPSAPTTPE